MTFWKNVSVEAEEGVLPEPEEAGKRMKWMAPFFWDLSKITGML